jgi:hypothetical protein
MRDETKDPPANNHDCADCTMVMAIGRKDEDLMEVDVRPAHWFDLSVRRVSMSWLLSSFDTPATAYRSQLASTARTPTL